MKHFCSKDLESESHGQSGIKNWSPTFKMGGKKRLTIAVGVHFLYFSIKVKRKVHADLTQNKCRFGSGFG